MARRNNGAGRRNKEACPVDQGSVRRVLNLDHTIPDAGDQIGEVGRRSWCTCYALRPRWALWTSRPGFTFRALRPYYACRITLWTLWPCWTRGTCCAWSALRPGVSFCSLWPFRPDGPRLTLRSPFSLRAWFSLRASRPRLASRSSLATFSLWGPLGRSRPVDPHRPE